MELISIHGALIWPFEAKIVLFQSYFQLFEEIKLTPLTSELIKYSIFCTFCLLETLQMSLILQFLVDKDSISLRILLESIRTTRLCLQSTALVAYLSANPSKSLKIRLGYSIAADVTSIFLLILFNHTRAYNKMLGKSLIRPFSSLKDRLSQLLPQAQARMLHLRKNKGDIELGKITVDQVIGGMRGMVGLVTETSKLDAKLGIRFRGLSIAECRENYRKRL